MTISTSGFRMYSYWNQQTTSKRRKDQDETYRQIIQSFQYRQNQEQRDHIIYTNRSQDQQI